MGNSTNEVSIQNENLFRALVCAPLAIMFVLLAANSVMNSGLIIFSVLYVLVALYFVLTTLAYAAYYTNDLYSGATTHDAGNKHLSKALFCTPLAILFSWSALNLMMSSQHVVFKVAFVLMALYFSLKALAHAAYYTNDCYAD